MSTENLEARIDQLEARCRRMQAIIISACLAIVAFFCLGGREKEKIVEAEEFRVVDAQGNERASLGTADGVTAFVLFDGKHKPALSLASGEKFAGLMGSYDGQQRVMLLWNGDLASMTLNGLNDSVGLQLSTNIAKSESRIAVAGSDRGEKGPGISLIADEKKALAIVGNVGNKAQCMRIAALKDGAILGIIDKDGATRAAFGIAENGPPELNLLDSNQKPVRIIKGPGN